MERIEIYEGEKFDIIGIGQSMGIEKYLCPHHFQEWLSSGKDHSYLELLSKEEAEEWGIECTECRREKEV